MTYTPPTTEQLFVLDHIARIDANPQRGEWVTLARPSDLPTVMRKAWDLARDHITG